MIEASSTFLCQNALVFSGNREGVDAAKDFVPFSKQGMIPVTASVFGWFWQEFLLWSAKDEGGKKTDFKRSAQGKSDFSLPTPFFVRFCNFLKGPFSAATLSFSFLKAVLFARNFVCMGVV